MNGSRVIRETKTKRIVYRKNILVEDLRGLQSNTGGVTPLNKLYRYAPTHRVGFLRRFDLKTGKVFGRNTGVYDRIYPFQFQRIKKEREICEFDLIG